MIKDTMLVHFSVTELHLKLIRMTYNKFEQSRN